MSATGSATRPKIPLHRRIFPLNRLLFSLFVPIFVFFRRKSVYVLPLRSDRTALKERSPVLPPRSALSASYRCAMGLILAHRTTEAQRFCLFFRSLPVLFVYFLYLYCFSACFSQKATPFFCFSETLLLLLWRLRRTG